MTQMICPIVCPHDPNEFACHHRETHELNEGCDSVQGDCPICIVWTAHMKEFIEEEEFNV